MIHTAKNDPVHYPVSNAKVEKACLDMEAEGNPATTLYSAMNYSQHFAKTGSGTEILQMQIYHTIS